MQAEMSERMAEEGLEYGTRTRTYNSRLAQELGCWADGQQGGGRLHDDLFRAYFVDDVNLAVVDHLVAAGLSDFSGLAARASGQPVETAPSARPPR